MVDARRDVVLQRKGQTPRLGIQNHNAPECEETNGRRALGWFTTFFSTPAGSSAMNVKVQMNVGGVALPRLKRGSLFLLRTEGRETAGGPGKGKSNRVSCAAARRVQDNS